MKYELLKESKSYDLEESLSNIWTNRYFFYKKLLNFYYLISFCEVLIMGMRTTLRFADLGKVCKVLKKNNKKNVTTLSRSKLQNYKPPVLFTINTNTHLHSKPFNLLVTKPFMPGIQSHMHLQLFFTADYHPALARSLLNLPGQTHPHFTDTYPPPPHLYPHWSPVFLTTGLNTNGAPRDLFSATRFRLKGLSIFGLLQFCFIWSRMLQF